MGSALAILVFVLVPLATIVVLVAGVGLRIFPSRIEAIRFQDVSPAYVYGLLGSYSDGTYDGRFGYPSGFFSHNEKKSAPGQRLVFDEAQPSGAVSDGCAAGITAGGIGAGADIGGFVGFFIAWLGFMVALPFIIVSFLDRVYRKMLRSRVDVRLTKDGTDVVATFAFHGISGYFVKAKYTRAFAPPALPLTVFGPPAGPVEPTTVDRAAA